MKKAVIVAVAKDEQQYIEEWITHHLNIGFEEIYLFDNMSIIPIADIIRELPQNIQDKVIVELIDTIEPQNHAYIKGTEYYIGKAQWVAVIDLDEFIITSYSSIQKLLQPFDKFPNIGNLLIAWDLYNADGQKYYEDKPVMKRFKEILNFWPQNCWDHWKSIYRPECCAVAGTHAPLLKDGFCILDFEQRKNEIKINHYYTKSYEEWLWKVKKGSATWRNYRKYMEFFECNPKMYQDCYEEDYKDLRGYSEIDRRGNKEEDINVAKYIEKHRHEIASKNKVIVRGGALTHYG